MSCRLVIGNGYLPRAQMKQLANLLPALGSVHTVCSELGERFLGDPLVLEQLSFVGGSRASVG